MISWDRVNELKGEVGEEDFAEIVEIFLEEMDEAMEELRSGSVAEGLGSAMHFIKGAAMNLGFEDLGTICQKFETYAGEGKTDEINSNEVVICYDQSKDAFLNSSSQKAA